MGWRIFLNCCLRIAVLQRFCAQSRHFEIVPTVVHWWPWKRKYGISKRAPNWCQSVFQWCLLCCDLAIGKQKAMIMWKESWSYDFELVGLAEFSIWDIGVFFVLGNVIFLNYLGLQAFQASKEKHWWWSMCRLLQAGPVTTKNMFQELVCQSETHSNMQWVYPRTHHVIVICLCIFFLIIEKFYLSKTYSSYENLWLFRVGKSKTILMLIFF